MIMDTYKAVQKLVSIGVDKEHAVALTEIINEQNSDLATKSDIALVKKDIERLEEKMATKEDIKDFKIDMANLKIDMANLKTELSSNMAKLHSNTIKWIFGLYLTSVVTIIFSSPIIKVIQQFTL